MPEMKESIVRRLEWPRVLVGGLWLLAFAFVIVSWGGVFWVLLGRHELHHPACVEGPTHCPPTPKT